MHKKLTDQKIFNLLSWTWGIIMSFMGAVVCSFLMLCGKKPEHYGNCTYIAIGKNWGGLEFGWFFLCDEAQAKHIKDHEYGHGLQNCLWGPFFLILWFWGIGRYWYREFVKYVLHKPLGPYDAIWFEGQATQWGTECSEILTQKEE